MKKSDRSVKNVSIIGGADGPTSIFIAGRTEKAPLKVRVKNWIYCRRRERIAGKIRPNPHTLRQTAVFMKKEYGAVEISKESHRYQEMKASLKEGIIIQEKPELLEGIEEITRPEEYTKEAMEEMFQQIKKRSEAIARIPDDQITTDFHVYEVSIAGGRMEIEMDYQWDILGISYSGNKRAMKELKKMGRRLYLFYGVTQDDIDQESKRYSFLLTALAS